MSIRFFILAFLFGARLLGRAPRNTVTVLMLDLDSLSILMRKRQWFTRDLRDLIFHQHLMRLLLRRHICPLFPLSSYTPEINFCRGVYHYFCRSPGGFHFFGFFVKFCKLFDRRLYRRRLISGQGDRTIPRGWHARCHTARPIARTFRQTFNILFCHFVHATPPAGSMPTRKTLQ